MTNFEIKLLSLHEVSLWSRADGRHDNWPVVYTLDDGERIYIGESANAVTRMRQHLESEEKRELRSVRVVVGETFNKSACLDLESMLIRLAAAEGRFKVLNRNAGMSEADYYNRQLYQQLFEDIFQALKVEHGLFAKEIDEIKNLSTYKLSPFLPLVEDQRLVMSEMIHALLQKAQYRQSLTAVLLGEPGSGKTVLAIYLMKLLADVQRSGSTSDLDLQSPFGELFVDDTRYLLRSWKVRLVVPQQSLRASIKKVFQRTDGLDATWVMSPFEVGESEDFFDLLILDETHRLSRRANQASAELNRKFAAITSKLCPDKDFEAVTQLDWIKKKSNHQILMIDPMQSVRPADLPFELQMDVVAEAKKAGTFFHLSSQMRVRAGKDYVGYVRAILSDDEPPSRLHFPDYEFRLFWEFEAMRDAIRAQDSKYGLSRLLAGFAWPWRSKKDKTAYDIVIDGCTLRWNTMPTDWIESPNSVNEVGSVHTVQGYDLNYAGVIIGADLYYDENKKRIEVARQNYFDRKGKEGNKAQGWNVSDEDLRSYVLNVYSILLTRGVMGTYLYVVDDAMRRYISRFADA